MQSATSPPKKRRFIWNTVGNIFVVVMLSIFFLIFLSILLVQTAPVQNYARGKIQSYLSKKLNTRVEIGNLSIRFPSSLTLKNVFIEDRSKDTLISGGQLTVDLNMYRLLKNEVLVKNIDLENILLKIKRLQPDTVFNFQFIVDAFSGTHPASTSKDTSAAMKMSIDNIVLNNSRIVYRDTVTGNDMDLYFTHFDSKITTFDPSHLLFNVPSITLKGVKGYFYQNEPLKEKIIAAVVVASKQPDVYLQLKTKELLISDIDVDYKSVPSLVATSLKIGKLTAHPDILDMKNGMFGFKDLTMINSHIGVIMSNSPPSPPVTGAQQAVLAAAPAFTFKSNNLSIKNSSFSLDNTSMPKEKYGMDYGHMGMTDLNIEATNFLFNTDTTLATINQGSFKEKSGFVLNALKTNFLYTNTGTSLTNLYLKTPGTLLQNTAVISYPSLDALTKNPGVLYMDLNFVKSHLLIKDLLTFAPMLSTQPAFANAAETWLLDGRITGRIDNLHFQNVQIKEHETSLVASGTITGLPDPKKFSANLNITTFTSTRKDIEAFLPKNTLPATFKLPENISASGSFKGDMNNLTTDMSVRSSLGAAKIKGSIKNLSDPKKASYDMAVNASNLNVGEITGQSAQVGMVSTNFTIKGTGYDPATANAKINGVVTSAELNKYTYHNIKIDGSIANKNYIASGSVHDPNIDLSFEASGSLNSKYPSLKLSTTIDSIKTLPLHFGTQDIVYHGKISGDFTNLDPDNLEGNLTVTHSVIITNGQRMRFDSLQLIAANDAGNHHLNIKSDFLNITLQGMYKLTQLADVLQKSIDPYFAISTTKNITKVDAYNFSISGGVVENAALKAFMPGITTLKTVNFGGHFASDSGWSAFLSAPYIVYTSYSITDLKLEAITKNGALTFNSSLQQLKSSSVQLFSTSFAGILKNNRLDFTLNTKDSKSTDKYTISGILSQPSPNNYSFSLKPDNLLLNYKKWTANANNSIVYSNGEMTANNFIVMKGAEQLSLNSIGSGTNKPLSINFKDFNIATLTGFVQSDSLIVGGTLNGNATIKNIQTQPTFTSDLTVNDISIYKDTLGMLVANVNNTIANQYTANITLKGRGNEVNFTGDYYVKPDNNSSFNLTMNILSLQMKSLEGFTKGGIRNTRGSLSGKIALSGTVSKPNIDGRINFDNTAFVVSALNSVFKVDKEAIAIINNKGIEFNSFTIRDTANNAVVIDGAVNTSDFLNYRFNLKINADNFQAINSTKRNNRLFYGKMVFSTALTIKGTPTNPIVDGSLTINDKTDFSVVLPQDEPGVVQRDGIVRFVDYSATPEDSLFMTAYDSLKLSPLQGYSVSLNINVSKAATFNLIVDEGNGDFLRIKGDGQLTAGIDESGKITLVGSYEISEGSYDLSFNFIKRKFLIQAGSRIVWTGEPTTADVDVTAIYIASTAPLDLVQGQTEGDPNTYKQKLPFEVHLALTGELFSPQITFDIILPEEKNYNVSKDIVNTVESKLIELRQEPGELNKQVFALLLLNRFVGQNPFDNSSGGGLDANTFARQSVSRLLTEQLNKLTEGLIEGVDINFDLATTQDYTTGSMQNRTDFNVAISKRLLNDRLTVTVGSNFELEGPQQSNQQQNNLAGNIAIDYKLSKDGKYLLRVYRKNDYEGAIEGYIIETGVGFIISVDYNRFKEIFRNKRSRKKAQAAVKSSQPTANVNPTLPSEQK